MKILGKGGLSGLFEQAVVVLMVLGSLVLIGLPMLLTVFYRDYAASFLEVYGNKTRLPITILLYLTGLLAMGILWFSRNILHSINNEKPFTYANVKNIRLIGAFCAAITLCYAVFIPILFSVSVILMFMAFFMVTVVVIICAELFAQAVHFKEENEFTV